MAAPMRFRETRKDLTWDEMYRCKSGPEMDLRRYRILIDAGFRSIANEFTEEEVDILASLVTGPAFAPLDAINIQNVLTENYGGCEMWHPESDIYKLAIKICDLDALQRLALSDFLEGLFSARTSRGDLPLKK